MTLLKSEVTVTLWEIGQVYLTLRFCARKQLYFQIYASTVVKFVASEDHLPAERLAIITSLPHDTTKEGMFGVDQLYTKVLEYVSRDDIQFYSHLRSILGAVLLTFNPLSIKGLSELLKRHYASLHIPNTIRSLHSLLLVPDSMDDPILTFHKSFPDFLMDPKRCGDKRFFVEPAVHHTEILLSCLNLMMERLEKNICKLDDYTVLSKVKDLPDRQKDHIGDALGYACCFWTKHLLGITSGSSHIEEVQKAIDGFFTTCLLSWIEVLSLMGNLNIGVYALNDIKQWYALVSCV